MDSRDRRGQIILVAGFGLAVAFVVLALVLNTVVFTENLATRNHDRTDEALAFEGAVEEGVGGLVSAVNDNESATYDSLETDLDAAVSTWSANATYLSASRGSLRNATLADVEDGTQLTKPDGETFENDTLAADVEEVRRFNVLVTPETDDGLTVSVVNESTSASWNVTVSENASDSAQTDVVVRQNDSVVTQTQHNVSTAEVDLTEGAVNGTHVENWTFGEGVDAPYNVSISSDGETTGKYVLFVDERTDSLTTDAPTVTPAVFRAFVDISVQTDSLTYESNVSVAPERPPGNETYAVDG